MTTEITPAEAQLWLAGLEKEVPCPNVSNKHKNHYGESDHWCLACGGTSVIKVPVLEGLRDTCPNFNAVSTFVPHTGLSLAGCQDRQSDCHAGHDACKGTGWVLNSTRQAIQDAMNKAGWDYTIKQIASLGYGEQGRVVHFWKDGVGNNDADDHIAAMKAMQKAGYGTER